MEKIAYEIEDLLQEKLSCYGQLRMILEEEKSYIKAMDLNALWQTSKSKRQLAKRIETLRQDILFLLENAFLGMNMDTRTFSLAYLIQTLPLKNKVKNELRKIKEEINTVKDQVVHLAKFNREQVQKHLMVVDDIMSIIGDNSSQAQYTGAGIMQGYKKQNCIFRAEV